MPATTTETREERLTRSWCRMASVIWPALRATSTHVSDPYGPHRIPWVYNDSPLYVLHDPADPPRLWREGVVVWARSRGARAAADRFRFLEQVSDRLQEHNTQAAGHCLAFRIDARPERHDLVLGIRLEDSELPYGFGGRLRSTILGESATYGVSLQIAVTRAANWTTTGERHPFNPYGAYDGPTPAADLPGYPDGGDPERDEPDEDNREWGGESSCDCGDCSNCDDPWGDGD